MTTHVVEFEVHGAAFRAEFAKANNQSRLTLSSTDAAHPLLATCLNALWFTDPIELLKLPSWGGTMTQGESELSADEAMSTGFAPEQVTCKVGSASEEVPASFLQSVLREVVLAHLACNDSVCFPTWDELPDEWQEELNLEAHADTAP